MVLKGLILGGLLLAVGGCANLGTVRDAPLTAGTVQAFAASYDQTTAATLATLNQFNVTITSTQEQPTGLQILVTKFTPLSGWGEVGRILVERTAAPPTPVRVVWERRSQLSFTGTGQAEFSRELYSGIQQNLAR